MAIIAKDNSSGFSGESFVPAPVGMHRAICCDVVDLGQVTDQFGTKHRVRIIWQTEATMPDGKPYMVDRKYTLTLGDKSALRRDLEAWRGRPFTLQEAAGFDLERLIGVPCGLVVVHKAGSKGDRMFANIQAVCPAMPGAPMRVRDYVRVADRVNGAPQPHQTGPSFAPPPTGYPPAPMDPASYDPFDSHSHVDGEPVPF